MSASLDTKYVLVMHSGLGPAAVEHIGVSAHIAAQVEHAGGAVCDSYGEGDAVAFAALRFPDVGIEPTGVRGRFCDLRVAGLPVLIPDPTLRAFIALRRNNRAGIDDTALMRTAEAIVAEGLPSGGLPAR